MTNKTEPTIIKPNNEIQKKLYKIWIDTLQNNEFGVENSFFDVGGHSLMSIPMVQKIEKAFNLEIDLYHFFTNPTIVGLESLIKAKQSEPTSNQAQEQNKKTVLKNFAPIKPEGSKHPFIMVHGDNCNTFLPKLLEEDRPYLGYLHLGSDGEKFNFKTIQELAGYYNDQLLVYKTKGPYLLGGHSFGGIVAYEMAVQLIKKGYDVPLIILSDSIIPKKIPVFAFKRGIKERVRNAIKRKICMLFVLLGKPIPISLRNFYILDSYDKLGFNYKPSEYAGKVLLIRASLSDSTEKYLGWDKGAKNISYIELEGTHNGIINNDATIIKYVDIINNELTTFISN